MFVGIRRWHSAVAEMVTPNQLFERVSRQRMTTAGSNILLAKNRSSFRIAIALIISRETWNIMPKPNILEYDGGECRGR